MTSIDTARSGGEREGQDPGEVPSLGEIRFHRVMRLACGLAVWPVAVVSLVRITESGTDPAEVMTAIVAVAMTALFCAYAGTRASQLQTEYDEATAPSATIE